MRGNDLPRNIAHLLILRLELSVEAANKEQILVSESRHRQMRIKVRQHADQYAYSPPLKEPFPLIETLNIL